MDIKVDISYKHNGYSINYHVARTFCLAPWLACQTEYNLYQPA